MSQKPFATSGTLRKLNTIADYLHFYSTALTGKFRLTYIDGFAGSGDIPAKEELPLVEGWADLSEVTEGSALRALRTTPGFDRYVFIDSKKGNIDELAGVRDAFPEKRDRISLIQSDANEAICSLCNSNFGRRDRAVIFLDPFGNQVAWKTIQVIANTPGIDLWYLFPAGLGVLRQITKKGQPHEQAENSLDTIFGTGDWRNHLIRRESVSDLFGANELTTRVETAEEVTRYMVSRLKSEFGGRVLDTWLPLGKGRCHWYSLILAWSNPSPKAGNLIKRVGRDILEKAKRRH